MSHPSLSMPSPTRSGIFSSAVIRTCRCRAGPTQLEISSNRHRLTRKQCPRWLKSSGITTFIPRHTPGLPPAWLGRRDCSIRLAGFQVVPQAQAQLARPGRQRSSLQTVRVFPAFRGLATKTFHKFQPLNPIPETLSRTSGPSITVRHHDLGT